MPCATPPPTLCFARATPAPGSDSAGSLRPRRGGWPASARALELRSDLLEVLVDRAPGLLGVVAQDVRGMEGGHEQRAAVLMEAPAQGGDRRLAPQQRPGREGPERHDDKRPDDRDLREEKALAGGDLVGLGVAIPGRAALDDVRDVDFIAREPPTSHLHRLDHLGEQLTGASHERKTLRVLVRSRSLADEHQACLRAPRSEDDRLAAPRELAADAVAGLVAPELLQEDGRISVLRRLESLGEEPILVSAADDLG